jgi:hypothetical protein
MSSPTIEQMIAINEDLIKKSESTIYSLRKHIAQMKKDNETLKLHLQPKLFNDGEHLSENPTKSSEIQ